MTQAEIRRMQEKIGTTVDGFWGTQSIAACQRYLKSLMPNPRTFPVQARVETLYGQHGVRDGFTPPQREIRLPFTIYYEGTAVNRLKPHERCADSLLRVFERLASVYPNRVAREGAGILTYDGLYNPRRMRGNSGAWSMHAWAIAIDLNAARNGNQVHWPSRAVMPLEVMECFAQEGWLAAGAFWSRDAMHFQATAPS